jgi:hypothetical protein
VWGLEYGTLCRELLKELCNTELCSTELCGKELLKELCSTELCGRELSEKLLIFNHSTNMTIGQAFVELFKTLPLAPKYLSCHHQIPEELNHLKPSNCRPSSTSRRKEMQRKKKATEPLRSDASRSAERCIQHGLDLATRSDKEKVLMYEGRMYLQMILLFDSSLDGGFDGCGKQCQFPSSPVSHSLGGGCLPSVVTLASPKSIFVPGM